MPAIEKMNGVAASSIEKVDGVASGSIESVAGLTLASNYSAIWTFDGQTVNTASTGTTTSGWVTGTGLETGWAGGGAVCSESGNRWANGATGTDTALSSTKTATGWNVDSNATASNYTGPSGAHDGSGGHDTSFSTRYIYAETSSTAGTRHHITRTPGLNFSTLMSNTSNNLDLKFYLHAYGQSMGRLHIYIDDSSTSQSTSATLLGTCVATHTGSYTTGRTTMDQSAETNGGSFTPATIDYASGTGSSWTQLTLSLNGYRKLNNTYYIYFVYQNGTGANGNYRGDIAIDDVEIVES